MRSAWQWSVRNEFCDARVVAGQGGEHGRVVRQQLRVRADQRRPLRRLAEVVLRQRRRRAAVQGPGPLLALQRPNTDWRRADSASSMGG